MYVLENCHILFIHTPPSRFTKILRKTCKLESCVYTAVSATPHSVLCSPFVQKTLLLVLFCSYGKIVIVRILLESKRGISCTATVLGGPFARLFLLLGLFLPSHMVTENRVHGETKPTVRWVQCKQNISFE